jgi:uncharacterized protein with GYD domain
MVTYIVLLNFTEQGIRNVKQTVERAKAFEGLVKKHGGTTRSIYWTQGNYDVVATIEAPDEERGLAILFTLGSLGNMRSQTLRAYTAQEMDNIIKRMG